MDKKLIQVLNDAGKATETVAFPNGSQVAMLPYGGRIVGLFAKDDPRNFYWTNPVLKNSETAKTYFGSDEWQNTGGDRTWLAPEIDFFFPKYPDLAVYHQPRQLDTLDYRVGKAADGTVKMTLEFEIDHFRHKAPIQLRLTKAVEAVDNPLRHEAIWKELSGVTFASYGLRSTLEFTASPAPQAPVGLWHLIQMPHGGEMILPTYGPAKPQTVFGEVPKNDIRTDLPGGGAHYFMRAPAEQKISLRAAASTGRAGYYYEADGVAQLVIRNFFVNPSGEYVDAPWTKPDDVGYGVQVCNVNGKWGIFSELEYHIPAIGLPGGKSKADDFAQVWAYRGTRAQMNVISEHLLGIPLGGK
jgi:hypothetical protein